MERRRWKSATVKEELSTLTPSHALWRREASGGALTGDDIGQPLSGESPYPEEVSKIAGTRNDLLSFVARRCQA